MPSAPQSLSEIDQAGALFTGLFVFVSVGVVIPVLGWLKAKYREEESFRRVVNRGLQAGGLRRLFGGVGGSIPEVQFTAALRVNSGIVLEEGRASLSRCGTLNVYRHQGGGSR